MLGSDDDFWLKVGIDPVRMMTSAGTYYTLRCYLDDQPIFLGRNGRISVFGSERSLARYLADEHDHDLSDLATYDDIRTAATDGSLRVDVSDDNVYVLTGIVDDLADGPDAIDRDQLELAVELLRDVGEYAEDTTVEETLDADQPLGRAGRPRARPGHGPPPEPAVRQGRRAVGGAGGLPGVAAAPRVALQLGRPRVPRLVQAELAAAGKPDAGQQAPALVADRSARSRPWRSRSSTVALMSSHIRYSSWDGCAFGGMHRHLAGRELEDQPAAAGVDVWILQHVAEERPVRVGVAAVDDDVTAGDHGATVRPRDEFADRRRSAPV